MHKKEVHYIMVNIKFSGTISISSPTTIITIDTSTNTITLTVYVDKWCEIKLNNNRLSKVIMDDIVDDIIHNSNSNLVEDEDGLISLFFGLINKIEEAIIIRKKEEDGDRDEYV